MIIALTGRKGSGKDTVAVHLQQEYGFAKYAFADPMKKACRIIFGWSTEAVYGDLKERIDPRYGISPRKALQTLGTEWGQHELSKHDDFGDTTGRMLWVKRFTDRMYTPAARWVITDLRFPHEYAGLCTIPNERIILVRITRQSCTGDDAHGSEVEMDELEPDYTIGNDGTQGELFRRVDRILTGEGVAKMGEGAVSGE